MPQIQMRHNQTRFVVQRKCAVCDRVYTVEGKWAEFAQTPALEIKWPWTRFRRIHAVELRPEGPRKVVLKDVVACFEHKPLLERYVHAHLEWKEAVRPFYRRIWDAFRRGPTEAETKAADLPVEPEPLFVVDHLR